MWKVITEGKERILWGFEENFPQGEWHYQEGWSFGVGVALLDEVCHSGKEHRKSPMFKLHPVRETISYCLQSGSKNSQLLL